MCCNFAISEPKNVGVTINLYDFLLVVCVVIVYRFRDIIVCLTYMTASDLERSGCVRSRRLK